MKWFKHLTGSGDDPDIDDSVSLFGADGYYVFFRTLEIMSREFDYESPGKNQFSVSFFRKKFRVSWQKTAKILAFFDERGRIFCKISNGCRLGRVDLYCPKLKDLCDEHTRKVIGKKSGVSQEPVRSQSVTTETEPETEPETDYNRSGERPPIKSKRKRSETKYEGNGVVENIKRSCDDLIAICKEGGHAFNPYQWVQAWANKNGHPGAILDSLNGLASRLIDKKQERVEKVYGYCDIIMKTKNGNYWELENRSKSSKLKIEQINADIQKIIGGIG